MPCLQLLPQSIAEKKNQSELQSVFSKCGFDNTVANASELKDCMVPCLLLSCFNPLSAVALQEAFDFEYCQ